MRILRAVAAALAAGGLLWLMLDSRLVSPEPPPPGLSAALGALGGLFGLGAVVMQLGGRPERAPLLAGLAAGVGGYAILRLVALP
ncbi:MAG: hypothetical protein U0807_05825 [Candidatus Binatia bacterium]